MEVRRLYLDTNIIISLGEGRDEVAALLTDLVVQRSLAAPRFLCTSELTLTEALVAPYRSKDERLISQYELWLTGSGLFEVGPVNTGILSSAALLRADYRAIKLPDAIHLSTAFHLGCSHFLTADKRLHDSFALIPRGSVSSDDERRIDVVGPEPSFLISLIQG